MHFLFSLLAKQKGSSGEWVNAGLTRSSCDYTDAGKNIPRSQRVQAGGLSTIRPALDSTLTCLFASFQQLTEQQQGQVIDPTSISHLAAKNSG